MAHYFKVLLFTLIITSLIFPSQSQTFASDTEIIKTGAERTEQYLPWIRDKKVAIMANQTSVVGNRHLVDTLLSLKINILKIFSPEIGRAHV